MIWVSMVISIVVVVAHCPAAGVKVYVVVPVTAVLITAGLHVPVIGGILVEVNDSSGAVLFWHSGPICANVGATWVSMVIFMVAVEAH